MRILLALLLLTGTLAAQSPITFSGRHAQSGAVVELDSVYVLSESGSKDTTLVGGMSLQMDWLTSVPPRVFPPEGLQLGAPYPNGFDAGTQFDVRLDRRTRLTLDVCNTLGRRVISFEHVFESGTQLFRLDASTLAPGVYFLRASDGRSVQARKLLKITTPSSSATATRLIWMGAIVAGETAMQQISAIGKQAGTKAGTFTFIGYAEGFLPDTLAQVTPSAGRNYEFTFQPSQDSRKIRSGRFIDEGRTSIPTAGGAVTIAREGSPVNGLYIRIPADSYTVTKEFSIGYAAVEGHDLGQYFHPISPLITIGNGGGYSDQVMELTIPIELPAGHFAMAWLYNERTGEVEALPPLAQDAHSITVMTRHFSTSSVSGLGKKKAASDPFANVVVTSILESTLTGQTVINTGFQPGRDDWEFVNHGSVLAPNGHCAGQSITAMWYYYEQRLQGIPPRPALHGAYDRVNKSPDTLWMDNREGNRFASVIQKELDFEGRLAKLLWKGRDSSYHSLSWKAFGAAMLVTGCPQYVGLTRLLPNGDPDGGHAIIAYKQSFAEGKLYVADPNYPGALRSIQYDAQQGYYTPYSTKQNADEIDERAYQNIGFTAKTALIEWDRVTARWPEFLDKSIGNAGNPAFPAYQVEHTTDEVTFEVVEFDRVLTVVSDSIHFRPKTHPLAVYTLEGVRATINLPASWYIPLNPGLNTLGLYTSSNDEFVDFRWVTVNSVRPRISKITPVSGKPGAVILIEGTDFGDDRSKGAVLFSGIAMTEIAEWSDTAIRAKIPANAVRGGYVTVRREKAESNRKWLDILLTITNVAPLHGYWNDKVTILGTGLTKVMYVRFNGHLVPECYEVPKWTDSLMVVTVPNNCVGGVITFDPIGSGETITGPAFTHDSLTISSADPLTGPAYTIITITGERFGQAFWPGSQVTIGGVKADPVLSWTETEIKIYGNNTGRIAVTVCGKTVDGPVYIKTP